MKSVSSSDIHLPDFFRHMRLSGRLAASVYTSQLRFRSEKSTGTDGKEDRSVAVVKAVEEGNPTQLLGTLESSWTSAYHPGMTCP